MLRQNEQRDSVQQLPAGLQSSTQAACAAAGGAAASAHVQMLPPLQLPADSLG